MRTLRGLALSCLVSSSLVGCGDGGPPPGDVAYGVTTFVVVVNPTVNDATAVTVPAPGIEAEEVELLTDDDVAAVTDMFGVAVLPDVAAGSRTLDVDGVSIAATMLLEIDDGDLVEVAIAADGAVASTMSEVVHRFGGTVVEVDPGMSVDAVNAALSRSNSIVFFGEGTYSGDLSFSGSGVTLFGAGPRGGHVILDGNITVEGSGNRIRGATITGDLDVPGSNASISFTRVLGTTTVVGSSAVLLFDDFCGPVSVSGSGAIALDNLGMAPMSSPAGC